MENIISFETDILTKIWMYSACVMFVSSCGSHHNKVIAI